MHIEILDVKDYARQNPFIVKNFGGGTFIPQNRTPSHAPLHKHHHTTS